MGDDSPEYRSIGRPRQDLDSRVLDATHELLQHYGFHELSISKVATRSGISRPTIYRRWADKTALIVALVRRIHENEAPPSYEGLAPDLLREMQAIKLAYTRMELPIVMGFLAVPPEESEVRRIWREEVVSPRRARIQNIVREAVQRGEARADADPSLVSAALAGVFYGAFTQGTVLSDSDIEELVRLTVVGLCRCRQADGVSQTL